MNIYFEPVNLNVWNMLEKVKREGHIEWFSALNSMQVGDLVLLYVGKQKKTYENGIYAVGTIVRGAYVLENNCADSDKGKTVVDVRIDKIDYLKPFITYEECKSFIAQFRTAHRIKEDYHDFILTIINNVGFKKDDFDEFSDVDSKILKILSSLCPDFAPYNYLKKYDLFKGSLFGGTNIYFKKGENGSTGMVTTKTNIKLYNLDKYPYNFKSASDRNGSPEYGWSGETLLQILEELQEIDLGIDKQSKIYFNDEEFHEGHAVSVRVNKYERSSVARNKCIEYHGCRCSVCGIDFGERYGDLGEGFIHVHHLKPLHTIGKDYVVDCKNDLIPVCPNCHAMIHRIDNVENMTIEEIKKILN